VTVIDRAQLGDFLRRRREGLSPAAAGLPAGNRRRTPGLRRDEVAALANMSAVYYERIEQGRGPQPSAAVLSAMARALQLSSGERDHLYLLAGRASPAAPDHDQQADPALTYVLQAVEATTPAFISDDLGNVLAQNWLNLELFGQFAGLSGYGSNLTWRWFTSAGWRYRTEPPAQHQTTGQAHVADLRVASTRRGPDRAATELVSDLRQASPQFARLWDQHEVSGTLQCSAKVVHDPRIGRVDLDSSVVTSPRSAQRLILLHPARDTPSQQRLAQLAARRYATTDGPPTGRGDISSSNGGVRAGVARWSGAAAQPAHAGLEIHRPRA
jgi:transcriptional regulator with XRE-family HTH domain